MNLDSAPAYRPGSGSRSKRVISFLLLLAALLFTGCHSKVEGVRLELLAAIELDEGALVDAEGREVTLDELTIVAEMVELIGCDPSLGARLKALALPSRARAYHGGPTTPTTYAHHSPIDLTRVGEAPFGDPSDHASESGFSPPANRYCAAFIRLGAMSLSGLASGEPIRAAIEHLRLDLSLELDEPGALDAANPDAEFLFKLDVNALIGALDLSEALSESPGKEALAQAITSASSIAWRAIEPSAP